MRNSAEIDPASVNGRIAQLRAQAKTEEDGKRDYKGGLRRPKRSTLRSRPSFLASMFSGRHALSPSGDDGSHFIDRDPTHFRLILNFLRTGTLDFPPSAQAAAARAVPGLGGGRKIV